MSASGLVTEFPFTLPRGYVDPSGTLHRDGVMRLATARDEIMPLRDPRVRDNEAYLTVLLLSRVISRLGALPAVSEGVIEGMFATDLAFLQDHYRRINSEGQTRAAVRCPGCHTDFEVDLAGGRPGGIVTYAPDQLLDEVAYVAYHLHWPLGEVLDLEHPDRQRFVERIGRFHATVDAGHTGWEG